MVKTKKEQPKKVTAKPDKPVTASKEVSKPHPAEKAAAGIFAQIQAKTGIDNKKINEWQKKWIALPEHRTKYEHLKNAPDVVGEEIFAIANDIIDFIQREEGGKSIIFKKIKENADSFIHNPSEYLKHGYEGGKKFAIEAKSYVEKKASQAKEMYEKAKNKSKEGKNTAEKKASEVKESAGKTIKSATKPEAAKSKKSSKSKTK
jgi:hypothetical protein